MEHVESISINLFFLTFEVDKQHNVVRLLDYDHHDNIY